MTRIFVAGNSHITALVSSYKAAPPGVEMEFALLNEQQFQPVMQGDASDATLAERVRKARERRGLPRGEGGDASNPTLAFAARVLEAQADLHVSMVGGNDHSILVMLNHSRPFEVVLPEAPDLHVDPEAELLPAGLVSIELERRIAPHLKTLAEYRALVSGRLVHIESPPPVPSEAHIRKYPGVFRSMIEERGVSPALLRYKFWRLHSRLYREACARLGVEFLSVPEKMCDGAGMMIEAAWNPDPTHGNALYGGAVIAQLLREAA